MFFNRRESGVALHGALILQQSKLNLPFQPTGISGKLIAWLNSGESRNQLSSERPSAGNVVLGSARVGSLSMSYKRRRVYPGMIGHIEPWQFIQVLRVLVLAHPRLEIVYE